MISLQVKFKSISFFKANTTNLTFVMLKSHCHWFRVRLKTKGIIVSILIRWSWSVFTSDARGVNVELPEGKQLGVFLVGILFLLSETLMILLWQVGGGGGASAANSGSSGFFHYQVLSPPS